MIHPAEHMLEAKDKKAEETALGRRTACTRDDGLLPLRQYHLIHPAIRIPETRIMDMTDGNIEEPADEQAGIRLGDRS
jgi:hypothetical protein